MSNTLTKPTIHTIAIGAANDLRVMHDDLVNISDSSRRITEYRYIVFALMEKAGYTHQQIADYFKVNRETVTKGLAKLDDWLPIYKTTSDTYQRLRIIVLKEV